MKSRWILMLLLIICLFTGVSCDRRPAKKTQPDTPFASTPHKVVNEMLKLADVGKDDVVYDLGSGDGRIVIAAARDFGARGIGIELDGELFRESKVNAEKAGVSKKVRFIQEDFFETGLQDATVVTLYLLPEINDLLMPKLIKELRPGARIVSHMWGLGDWEPDKTLNAYGKTLYMWFVPAHINGEWRVILKNKDRSKEYNLSIRQSYQKIRASINDSKKRYEFTHTALYGNEINLYVSYAYEGKVAVVSMEGFVKGDFMEGKAFIKEVDMATADEYQWRAKRY